MGDQLLGTLPSAIATLVERSSRYTQLVALPDGHKAEPVRVALTASIRMLPAQLRRSLTWDQGLEMAEHPRFSIDSDVTVYFCDPRSPWQRDSNENTNALLRQYFPERSSVAVSQQHLDAVAAELNARPRKTRLDDPGREARRADRGLLTPARTDDRSQHPPAGPRTTPTPPRTFTTSGWCTDPLSSPSLSDTF